MRKIVMLCVMCLCGGIAMGQLPEVIEKSAEALVEGAVKDVVIQIPLIVPSAVEITGVAVNAETSFAKASKAVASLTATQRTLLGVSGISVVSVPEAFGHPLEGVSAVDAARLTLALAEQENQDVVRRVDWLKEDILHAKQYADHVRAQISDAIKPMQGEPLAKWTADQLPASEDIDFLCIGEDNAWMLEGLDVMDNLLTEMRAKYPERDIVMLTSFLPNQTVLFPGNEALVPRDYHNQVWNSALRNNITVVGADVSATMRTGYTNLQTGESESGEISSAQTATGQHMQRTQFFSLMNRIRMANTTHQEILFVLYGRPVNMLYNGFESVSARLEQQYQRVKVIHIAPNSGVDAVGMSTDLTTSMEKILPDNLAKPLSQQRAMAWQPLPRGGLRNLMQQLSGSDIRIKVYRQ